VYLPTIINYMLYSSTYLYPKELKGKHLHRILSSSLIGVIS